MKKFLLASGVVVVFVIYALSQRNEGSAPVIAPSNASTNSSSTTSSTSGSSPTPSSNNSNSGGSPMNSGGQMMGGYKNGSYTGDSVDAFYGYVQVKAIISGGKITDVQFLDYPHDRSNSVYINSQAMPYLTQEAIQAQSANVDIISGATATSQAFQQSLTSALNQAH